MVDEDLFGVLSMDQVSVEVGDANIDDRISVTLPLLE
jgi:hypothetical protein